MNITRSGVGLDSVDSATEEASIRKTFRRNSYQSAWADRNSSLRNDSGASAQSRLSLDSNPIDAWVEDHAIAAWQQPPPAIVISSGPQPESASSASMHAALGAPTEACQLVCPPPMCREAIDVDVKAEDPSPLKGHCRYVYDQELSRSAASWVLLARDCQTGQQVVIKLLPRSDVDRHLLARDVDNQRACARHPHIVQLHEMFLLTDYLAIVTSFCNGGNLAKFMRDWTQTGGIGEPQARFCFQQLIIALDFCHKLRITTRDVKMENVLLHWVAGAQRPILKLHNFGAVQDRSPEIMAPEVLFGGEDCRQTADIWAAGVLLYGLLTGVSPFVRDSDANESAEKQLQAMFLRIIAGRFLPVNKASTEVRALLGAMLQPSPTARITIAGILAHPWFTTDLPPQLQSINADLAAGSGALSGDASFVDPCSQSRRELGQLIDVAPKLEPSPGSCGHVGRTLAPTPQLLSLLEQQHTAELALQRERALHRQHQAMEAECHNRIESQLEQMRLLPEEEAMSATTGRSSAIIQTSLPRSQQQLLARRRSQKLTTHQEHTLQRTGKWISAGTRLNPREKSISELQDGLQQQRQCDQQQYSISSEEDCDMAAQ